MAKKILQLIGSCSGMAASRTQTGAGPAILQTSELLAGHFEQHELPVNWAAPIKAHPDIPKDHIASVLTEHCRHLAINTYHWVEDQKPFCVFGGDHSCAIGTWSGAAAALRKQGDLGLIWIDAHMDSHTPETSHTGAFHGMPVATLLGHGEQKLCEILDDKAKIHPDNLVLIGISSFEAEEAALLQRLGVKVYFIEDVNERGLKNIFNEALQYIKNQTTHYGISIDIDSMDPDDAPGTGCFEEGGLRSEEICQVLTNCYNDEQLVGIEIAEFDPTLDKEQKTEKIIGEMVTSIYAKMDPGS